MLGVIVLLQALTLVVSGPPTSPEYLPLRVAEAEGYFAREELPVTLRTVRAEVAAAEALAHGQADMAATSFEAIVRFGFLIESQEPQLVFGLTAAPPVALLVSSRLQTAVRSVRDLARLRVGITAPGAPEHPWLAGILARARLPGNGVSVVSLGARGVASAIASGDVQAALVHEPAASDLTREGRADVLVDLRTPDAAASALGEPTINAAVFVRRDRRPDDAALEAFARAVLAAERLIASEAAASLAARLPANVVGAPDEFARRIEATKAMYLPGGLASPERLWETVKLIRGHMPLPATFKQSRVDEMLHDGPVRRASGSPER